MNIEVGKKYLTHESSEVRIYAVDGCGQFPVHGAVKSRHHGGWILHEWTSDGKTFGYRIGGTGYLAGDIWKEMDLMPSEQPK